MDGDYQNNPLKEEIEKILDLCKRVEEEEGDSSTFEEPLSEEEMTQYEKEHNITIPETLKDWYRFSRWSQICTFQHIHSPKGFYYNTIPDKPELILFGSDGGEGHYYFDKKTGKFYSYVEGDVDGEYNDFKEFIKALYEWKTGYCIPKPVKSAAERKAEFLKKVEELRKTGKYYLLNLTNYGMHF